MAKSQWVTYIDWQNKSIENTTTSYEPTDGTGGFIEWDPDKYTGITNVFYELNCIADGACTPNSQLMIAIRLYDYTNNQQIHASFFTSPASVKPRRSANCFSSMPTSKATIGIQFRRICGASARSFSGRLIIYQESTSANKTRVFVPLGRAKSTLSNSYVRDDGIPQTTKGYVWRPDNFSNLTGAYYHATISASGGNIMYSKLDHTIQADALGEITTTNTGLSLVTGTNILGSLVSGSEYYMYYKASGTATNDGFIENAFLVLDLDKTSKFEGIFPVQGWGFTNAGTASGINQNFIILYDRNQWSNVNKTFYHQTTLVKNGNTTGNSVLFINGSFNDTSKLITTSNTVTIFSGTGFEEPNELGSVIAQAYISNAGRGMLVNNGNNWITQQVTNISLLGGRYRTLMGYGL